MKIRYDEPKNWRDLQNIVSEILIECGYSSSVEKLIKTVRGDVEVDVFAEKEGGFNTVVLCECKYWEGKVTQTIVHSFRTVVNDSGASYGIIISKSGFQKGCYSAAFKSNLSLLSFEEFQEKFLKYWFQSVVERNYKIGREIFSLKNAIIDISLSDYQQKEFDEIRKSLELEDYFFLTFKEHYVDLDKHEISKKEIDDRIKNYAERLPVEVRCYNDFFNWIYVSNINIVKKLKSFLPN